MRVLRPQVAVRHIQGSNLRIKPSEIHLHLEAYHTAAYHVSDLQSCTDY